MKSLKCFCNISYCVAAKIYRKKWVQYIFRSCTVWQFHNLMSYQLSFDYAIYFSNEFNRSIQNQRWSMTHKLTRFCALVLSKTPKWIKKKMLKFEWKPKFWIENSATKKIQLAILCWHKLTKWGRLFHFNACSRPINLKLVPFAMSIMEEGNRNSVYIRTVCS